RAQVVAVIAQRRVARGGPEIAEVPGRTGRVVIVVPGRRPRPRLVTSPGRVVAIGVFRRGAVVVDVVPYREDGPGDVVEQRGRLLVVDAPARGDVACADENRGRARRRRDGGGALLAFDGRGDRGGSGGRRGDDAARIHPGHTRVARRPGRNALPNGGAARIPGDRRQVDARADLEARGRRRYVYRPDRRGRRGVVAG